MVSALKQRTRQGREHRRSRFNDYARAHVAEGRIFPFLASMTVVLAFSAGVIVRLIDHKDFKSLGDALWWSIVTLATVGYGDIVPHTTWGRIVGSLVIVLGVTFISVLTATVTSYFVSANQEEFVADVAEAAEQDKSDDVETHRLLHELLDRVAVIERKLDSRSREEP
jgi:voltage-gated potassium channel Kch